jgi:hypothetical protein
MASVFCERKTHLQWTSTPMRSDRIWVVLERQHVVVITYGCACGRCRVRGSVSARTYLVCWCRIAFSTIFVTVLVVVMVVMARLQVGNNDEDGR